jgi:hypothetical protein
MEALIISLLLLVIGAQGGLWYKIGRVEVKLAEHIRQHNREE